MSKQISSFFLILIRLTIKFDIEDPLTNHKPVVRELTNEKMRFTRAAFLSSLSIVVSKYGTDSPDYKASSIPRSHVRAVLGPGFILLSALNSSTQIS